MIHKEFSVGSNPDIDIHIQSGRVDIKSGAAGIVKVDVDTKATGFVVEQRGDQIHISSEKNSGWSSVDSAYVVVEVPADSDATIAAASAKIEIDAPLRDLNVRTASGDIDVVEARNATIKTASGDARLGEVLNDVKVSSASGDINLGESGGKVNFSSASGDLFIGENSGAVTAATASGDVAIERFSGRQAIVKSMSGEVEIGVPPGTRVDLDATLMSGSLHTPEPSAGSEPSKHQISIKVKLVSGDLRIHRVAESPSG